MRLRSLGIAAVAAAALLQSCQPACAPPPPAPPPPPPDITSITITGQGNGHGRGMSAWGAYGAAVNLRWTWQHIDDYYYGGTVLGSSGNTPIGVRLLGADGRPAMTVLSKVRAAMWRGAAYGSLQAVQVGRDVYDIYAASATGCQGAAVGWTFIERTSGPITFTTTVGETSGAAGDVLGLCQPNGSIIYYRGALRAVTDSSGVNHVVNVLLVENYLKGVMSRELPSSWGRAGGGAGMNALRAFAVAQRSFALSQGRYPYANTCDTDLCQVYGGAAYRADADAPTSFPGAQVCLAGTTFECAETNRAIADTAGVVRRWSDGRIVSTEYSASHGPYSAGVSFPAVDDSMSNVPGNPLYGWTRTIDAPTLESRYGLGNLIGARSERDPASNANGVWGNRVVLQGTSRTVVVADLDVRNAFGFPSHGFTITAVNR